tara:strand:- start:2482 stop:3552 length:1071 start_codon:yes stop_codon:yes gene_type:complete
MTKTSDFFSKILAEDFRRLPESIRDDLSNHPFAGVMCPKCGFASLTNTPRAVVAERLQSDGGFLCHYCLNTGSPLTEDPYIAGTLYEHKKSILHLLIDRGLAKIAAKNMPKSEQEIIANWPELISLAVNEKGNHIIIMTLTINGKSHALTIRQWRTRLDSKTRQQSEQFDLSEASSLGIKQQEHQNRLRQIHPQATFSRLLGAKETSTACCNEVTRIGDFSLPHPPFTLDTAKIKRRIETNSQFCVACAREKGLKSPSGQKSLSEANVLWSINAALVARALGDKDISHARVERHQTNIDDSATINTSQERLRFQCHNPSHPSIESTFSNGLNTNKRGYCKICLSEAGIKNVGQLDF